MLPSLLNILPFPLSIKNMLLGTILVSLFAGCGPTTESTEDPHERKPGAWGMEKKSRNFVQQTTAETNAIQAWYDSMLLRTGFAGGMLIARNDTILFETYADKTIEGRSMQLGANTATHIASVSKTFTAVAILQLADAGQLALDSSLSLYLPEFPLRDITVRQLLNHRSGLPNYVHYLEEMGYDTSLALTNTALLAHLQAYGEKLPNLTPTNKRFSYCNTNYALLALLIERLTGKSYPTWMQENIFQPLGMTNSFVFQWADTARVPMSYDWRGRIYPYNFLDGVYGDKNIYSTPRDLLVWESFLRQGANLSKAMQDAMYQPYSFEKPGYRHYGLGWRLTLAPGLPRIIYHNGWWHGNNAVFLRLPDAGVVIIVLGNQFNRNIYRARVLANLFGNYGMGQDEEDSGQSKTSEANAATDSLTSSGNYKNKRGN